eukprot:TRINITY_DN125048_c0_g1_i1.p1 TRINITY_DN125048_c0_g1~~TRINITY_DN125048_c0_g1_i1.p1  ORF type:complete len:140 (+),score=23.07 TRINITY_DN125048_c0_g1_i1:2-421(+)
MQSDAGFAAVRHGDAEGHEFLGLEVENAALLHRLAQPAKAAGGLRVGAAEVAQAVADLRQFFFPAHFDAFRSQVCGHSPRPATAHFDLDQKAGFSTMRARLFAGISTTSASSSPAPWIRSITSKSSLQPIRGSCAVRLA